MVWVDRSERAIEVREAFFFFMAKGDLGGQRILMEQLEEYRIVSALTAWMKRG